MLYSPPCCGELLAEQDGEAPGADGQEGEGEAGEHAAQLQVQPRGHLHTLIGLHKSFGESAVTLAFKHFQKVFNSEESFV